jgi:hypothetical protein
MPRTTKVKVESLLNPGEDYDGTSDLTPFIASANNAVSWCVANAVAYGRPAIDTTSAEDMEAWLAAGLYCMSDQQQSNEVAGKSNAQFRGQSGKLSEHNNYITTACMLDPSKLLKAFLDNRIAGVSWLGRPPSLQTDYVYRN